MNSLMVSMIVLLGWLAAPAGAASLKKDSERKRAPDFDLAASDGGMVRLTSLAGRVVLIDFWATWCGPCKSSIPWLIQLSNQYRDQGLTVLGVSMDEQGWPVVKPFAEKMGMTYPVLLGNKRVGYLYGDADALPLAFFVDRGGRVAGIHLGPANRKDFEKTIRLLLEEPR